METEMIGNINLFETLLWAFSQKNEGTMEFYNHVSEMLIYHPYFDMIKLPKLSRIAYYFARTTKTKARGGFGIYKRIEDKLYTLIHQGKLEEMAEIIEVISNLIGNNIGSNRIHAVLEVKLYRELSKPNKQITAGQIVKLVRAFSYYRFKVKALELLL
jgi:hypothetical protein